MVMLMMMVDRCCNVVDVGGCSGDVGGCSGNVGGCSGNIDDVG